MARIHIFGAAGSGTTTLARQIGALAGWPAFDTDDYYWLPTDPPYQRKRFVDERLALMRGDLDGLDHFLLSGSLDGWGDPLVPLFDAVVFVTVPTASRMVRLLARERVRFGADIDPGGPMHDTSRAFLDWAAGYDAGTFPGRNRERHEAWITQRLKGLTVIRIANEAPLETVVEELVDRLAACGISVLAKVAG